jgi:hypothetical protein
MNEALTIEVAGLVLQNQKPSERVLAVLSSRSKRSVRELSEPISDVFKGVSAVLDQLVMNVIEKRTAVEFEAAFSENFLKYAALTAALSRIATETVPSDVLERLTRESICELEADFREKSLALFGAAVRDQAMFTIWTLRKISDLVTQISNTKIDESKRKEDEEYSLNFNIMALGAAFSLDCLNMSLRLNRPIYPEVMPPLIDGLRSIVNAYTWARRGLDLRFPQQQVLMEQQHIDDEEDKMLLRASMTDFASMSEDDEAPSNAA